MMLETSKSPEMHQNQPNDMKGYEMTSNATKIDESVRNGFVYYESAEDQLTGYQVHRMANKELEMAGLALIKPQMVYNYMKNRLIPTDAATGKITQADAAKWIKKYVDAKKARQSI